MKSKREQEKGNIGSKVRQRRETEKKVLHETIRKRMIENKPRKVNWGKKSNLGQIWSTGTE